GDVSSVTDYLLDAAGGNVNYGFPISEHQNLNASVGYRNTWLYIGANNISDEIQVFLNEHDNRRMYNELHGQISWRMNSLNRYIFATSGVKHSLELSFAVPKSHLQYYRLHGSAQWLKLLSPDVLFLTRGGVGYGNGYGKDAHLPFFKNFFMGGSRSLR
ncbi:MAG: BamA/TamA family outer membrane protein, partial [Pseudomonadota bacterium]